MSPTTYADVLARNVRAARSRAGLQQEPLAERMRHLGFGAWLRQTVANVEKGRRGLKAEEMLGLALCLDTTVERLMTPWWEDDEVRLPSGITLPQAAVRIVLSGSDPDMEKYSHVRWDRVAARGIRWEDNTPVRVPGPYDGSTPREDGEP